MSVRRQVSIPYLDKAESVSVVSFYVDEAALDAENTTGLGVVSGLVSAINALTLADSTGRITSVTRTRAGVIPTSDAAYNGNKLTVFYRDLVTHDKYQMTIPAVNIATHNTYPRSKDVILTLAAGGTAEIDAFISQFEAEAKSKDGNAVAIISIKKSSAKQGG